MADSKEVRLFSGGKDEYRDWRNWAIIKLKTMNPDRVPYEKWGLQVYTWLRPPAQTWFNEIDVETLEQAGGHLVIFNELDKRYPPKTLEDKLADALQGWLDWQASQQTAQVRSVARLRHDEDGKWWSIAVAGGMVWRCWGRLSGPDGGH